VKKLNKEEIALKTFSSHPGDTSSLTYKERLAFFDGLKFAEDFYLEQIPEKLYIIQEFYEEPGAGSSPGINIFAFTNEKLKNKFVEDWNKSKSMLEKSDTTENKYYGNGDWIYWLEIIECEADIIPKDL